MTGSLRGNRFIFVGGSPRSGTTLVQNMLDSHPDICGGPEFLHLPDIVGIRKKLHTSIAREWIDHYCSCDDVDRLTSVYIENLLLPLADKQGCEFLSEKTPSNVFVFTELLELFPDARCINVVRDPRAIVSSMLQVGLKAKRKVRKTQDFTVSILAAIRYVQRCLRAGFAAAESAPEKVLTIAYEQLVVHPEYETRRLCNFLGIEWSRQMMYPSRQKHLGEKAITRSSDQVWYDPRMYNRDPDPREIDKWRTHLTFLQKVVVAAWFRGFEGLDQFGYDFSVGSLSLLEYASSVALSVTRTVLSRAKVGR